MTSHMLSSRLGIEPIIQAPMAGVATPELAAAVSNAGGLGSIGIGASPLAQARHMIEQTKALTARPFNVNVFCHKPPRRDPASEEGWLNYLAPLFQEYSHAIPTELNEPYTSFLDDHDIFDMLLETRPAVVSFHFGLPAQAQVHALQQAGIYTLATATSLDEAQRLQALNIDAIVAQGIEAGGHRGMFDPEAPDEQLETLALIAALRSTIDRPIIAAGGIMDGREMYAAMQLGAAAVQLGTAFILCPESSANTGYRTHLKSQPVAETRLTSGISGRPARGLINRLIRYTEAPGAPKPAAYPITYDATKQLNALAAQQGCDDFAAHWAGQGVAKVREMPAAELVRRILQEYQSLK